MFTCRTPTCPESRSGQGDGGGTPAHAAIGYTGESTRGNQMDRTNPTVHVEVQHKVAELKKEIKNLRALRQIRVKQGDHESVKWIDEELPLIVKEINTMTDSAKTEGR